MPIYEWKCSACGEIFDKLVPCRAGDDVQQCPKCGSKRTHRTLTYPSGFIKKGDGFYKRN